MLCRILTELKLLDTTVGVVTLSAGVANDVVGWILLALCVALVNAGSGLTALWILLCCVGYMLLLVYAIKPALVWVIRRSGNIEHDPSQGTISLILLIALGSAFFTQIIGVHAIFGGFMAGLIIPRDNRFNIRVTEKLEDLIGAILLPLYFTLSGLKTNLGLLDTGTAWGYVFATTIVAFISKVAGAALAARFNGMVWRESFTIGVLMSCKGLVELIVLNIGLQAGILSQRTFTIFVVMALLTTFATTPIVSVLYPPSYQAKIEAWKRGEIDWDTGELIRSPSDVDSDQQKSNLKRVGRLLVYLRLDSMPAMLNLLSLFGSPTIIDLDADSSTVDESVTDTVISDGPKRAVWAHGIRLLQLTDRDSSVMTVSQVAEYSRHDPIVNTFRTVGQLHNLAASGEVSIMPETRFSEALVTKASKMSSDLLLVPWSETGGLRDSQVLASQTVDDRISSPYATFVKSIFEARSHNVAVFISRNDKVGGKGKQQDQNKLARTYSFGALKEDMPIAPLRNKPYHIFLAYFGDDDDKLAVRIVLQLCEKSKATATIARLAVSASGTSSSASDDLMDLIEEKLPEETASRVTIKTVPGATTAEDLVAMAATETEGEDSKTPYLLVLGRSSGADLTVGKLDGNSSEDMRVCLGDLAGHVVRAGVQADLLVVQAAKLSESQ